MSEKKSPAPSATSVVSRGLDERPEMAADANPVTVCIPQA